MGLKTVVVPISFGRSGETGAHLLGRPVPFSTTIIRYPWRRITLQVVHMPSYEIFGKFYDAVMGDRARSAKHLHKLICKAKPNARTVLELGCGTGSILKYLARYYDISGLDISGQMLSIARKKLPGAKLYRQDMVNFELEDRFDVICCVFDSINHITLFSHWNRVFDSVR